MRKTKFFRSETPPNKNNILEFVLILPVFLLLLVGVIDFSRLFYGWIIIENSTRFGVRYATTGNYDPKYCIDLDANNTPCDDASRDVEVDLARIPSIKDETRNVIVGLHYLDTTLNPAVTNTANEFLNITVCSARDGRIFTPPLMMQPIYADCRLPNGTFSENAADPGQRVVVAVDYNFTFMVLPIFGVRPSMIHLASYRNGIVELFRATRAINTPIPVNIPTMKVTPSSTITNTPLPSSTSGAVQTASLIPDQTPNQTQTLQSAFDEIDSQFKNLQSSNIAFNKPKQMKKDEIAIIELILNPSLSESSLATQVVQRGNFVTSTAGPTLIGPSGEVVTVETSQIEITPLMKAALKTQDPDAFVIKEMHDNAEQVISSVETTTWRWSVTAKKEGSQTLELTIYQLVKYEGKESWHEVDTYKANIVVEVTPLERVKSLDWKWFAGFILALVGSVLGILNWLNNEKKKVEEEKPAQSPKKKKRQI